MRSLIVRPLYWAAGYAAASYIAGLKVQDAINISRQIAKRGLRSTICPWDGPPDPPASVASTYKAALNAIKNENIDCYLSIKAPSIKYDFDIMTELADIARKYDLRIHFDSLAPTTASPSMEFFQKTVRTYPNLGYTLPSRWQRSIADAEKLIELDVPVRVVKGQWADPAEPNTDPKSNFLKLINVLAGRASHVAVATHDPLLAREALSRLKASGTSCELEQLYGLPMRFDSVTIPLGLPGRVYIPYGHAYLSYSLSAIGKRPVILIWLLKDFLIGIRKRFAWGIHNVPYSTH